MSSMTPRSPVNASELPVEGEAGFEHWLSARQQHLIRLYKHFRCQQYADRQTDWDGTPTANAEQADTIARTGVLPAGFDMMDGLMSSIPLRFRKPCAPIAMGRVVPLKLTSMLFGSGKHPKLTSDDPATEDWLQGFAESTRLWSKAKQARNLGGAMGAVGLGFKFMRGKPLVEVHDPRWSTPTFSDRSELCVKSLEKRYQYSEQVRTEEGFETVWYWYRRLVTDEFDAIWPKVRVQDGEEPDWATERYESVEHGYGWCPVVWVQNHEVEESIDGDEDCAGVWDLIESIDMLNSQARKGTIANCDPTLHVASEAEFSSLKKGSGTAIQTEPGGSLNYLEMTGSGIDKARALRDDMIEQLCTVARVSLDRNEGGPSRTVEEVEHTYSSMLENCDELREQYGELGVKRLLEMVLRAARKLSQTRVDTEQATGVKSIVRSVVALPKRRAKNRETGEVKWLERQLGSGEVIELRWPKYYEPSQADIAASVNAAGTAKTFGLIDAKHATEYVAEDFQIENVAEALEKIAAEQKAAAGASGEGSGAPSIADTVAQRTLSGAKNPLPDPRAKQLAAVAKKAAG